MPASSDVLEPDVFEVEGPIPEPTRVTKKTRGATIRNNYDYKYKMKWIRRYDMVAGEDEVIHPQKEFLQRYKLTKGFQGTFSKWLKNRERIEEMARKQRLGKLFREPRGSPPKFPLMEVEVYDAYKLKRSLGLKVSKISFF